MYILLSSFCIVLERNMYRYAIFFFIKYPINTKLIQFIPVLNFFITNWMLWCPDIKTPRTTLFKISLFRIALLLFRIALSLFRCLDVSQSRSFASLYRCFASPFRCFVVSHFRSFASPFRCFQSRPFVASQFRCFVLSLFRIFIVLYSRSFALSHFRCFVHSLFRTLM